MCKDLGGYLKVTYSFYFLYNRNYYASKLVWLFEFDKYLGLEDLSLLGHFPSGFYREITSGLLKKKRGRLKNVCLDFCNRSLLEVGRSIFFFFYKCF